MGVGNPYAPIHRRKRPLYLRNNKLIYIYYENTQNRSFSSLKQNKFELNIFISNGATGITKICQPDFYDFLNFNISISN